MYYRLNSTREVPQFYTIKLPSGRTCDWPKNCWMQPPNDEVAKYIERNIEMGVGGWERQCVEEAMPAEVKETRKRRREKKTIDEVELPPEPTDAPVVEETKPEEEEAPSEEEDDFMG